MEIPPEKRYNIFPMNAVFRVWPVLARIFWIAAAIVLAAPVALAEGDDSRPVSVGEFNRQVERQGKKLDTLDAEVRELSKNMAVLVVQVSALAKAVEKQGEQIGDVREEINDVRKELSALYRMIVGGAIALAVGLLAAFTAVLVLLIKIWLKSAKPIASVGAPRDIKRPMTFPPAPDGGFQNEWHKWHGKISVEHSPHSPHSHLQ